VTYTARVKTAHERYDQLELKKQPRMEAFYRCAEYTIPILLMRPGENASQRVIEPYSQLGGDILRNMASRMVLTTLPVNVTFLRLVPDPIFALRAKQDENYELQLTEALTIYEQKLMQEIDALGIRQVAYETFLYWGLVGDVLFHLDEDGYCRNFRIDEYVVARDRSGILLDIIVKEKLAIEALPQKIREHAIAWWKKTNGKEPADEDEVEIYTCIHRNRDTDNNKLTNKFEVYQECCDEEINEEGKPRKKYDQDSLPWIHVRYQHVSGSAYGIGMIEPIIGALITAEGQKQIMTEGGAALAKIAWGVDVTKVDIRDLRSAPNGGYFPVKGAMKDAVGAVQAQKNADLLAALQLYQEDKKSIYREGMIFDMEQTERTPTATHVDRAYSEMEMGRGGPLSMVTQEWTRPLGRLVIARLKAKKIYPQVDEDVITLRLITGLEAFGRGQELERTTRFLGLLTQTAPIIAQLGVFDLRDYVGGLALQAGVNARGLGLMSRQKIAQMQAAMQQQMAEQQTLPIAAQSAANMMEKQVPDAQPAMNGRAA
jgi:Autographiviridae portal protein